MLSVRPAALASSPVLAISAVPAPRTAICALSTLVPTLSCQGLVLCSHQVQKISQSIFIHSFFLPKRLRSKQQSVAELVELKLFCGAGAVISYFGSTALVTGCSWKKIKDLKDTRLSDTRIPVAHDELFFGLLLLTSIEDS